MNKSATSVSAFFRGLSRISILCFFILLLTPLACPASEESALKRHEFSAPHIGTTAQLVFYSTEDKADASKVARECFGMIREFDAIFSDYRVDSEVYLLSQKELNVPHRVSDALFEVVSCAQGISAKTGGAFDITLGADTKRWRKKRDDAGDHPAAEKGNQTSFRDLTLDPARKTISFAKRTELDLGGIAKGYIADRLMLRLKEKGIKNAAVVIGGDTVLSAAPPGKEGWRIGVTNPEHTLIGTLVLSDTALSTSGDSYQFFEFDGERQAHLIDPSTHKGVGNRLNVTTQASSAMEADAWATALRILPMEKSLDLARREQDLEAMFIPLSKDFVTTPNFPKLNERRSENVQHKDSEVGLKPLQR